MKNLGINDILETQRCILRIPKESEVDEIWNLIDDDVSQFMDWEKGNDNSGILENIQKTRKKSKEGISWDAGIYDKNTGECLGRCGIYQKDMQVPSFSIGYWLAKRYWGKGIIPESVNELIKYAFETGGFEKGILRCDSYNLNSEKVALKCGFSLEGIFKNHERIKGELRDTKFFGILRKEYLSKISH